MQTINNRFDIVTRLCQMHFYYTGVTGNKKDCELSTVEGLLEHKNNATQEIKL